MLMSHPRARAVRRAWCTASWLRTGRVPDGESGREGGERGEVGLV